MDEILRPAPSARPQNSRNLLLFMAVLAAGLLVGNLFFSRNLDARLYRQVFMENVAGTPYLVVETWPLLADEDGMRGSFHVYRLEQDSASWQTVVDGRTGPVLGTFTWSDPKGVALGLFNEDQVTLLRFKEEEVETEFLRWPFPWQPETGVLLGEELFVFGGAYEKSVPREQLVEVTMKVARFDGTAFKEVELQNPPRIKSGTHASFWIKAVYHEGHIHVFWRDVESAAGTSFDAPFTPLFSGPLYSAKFDGKCFDSGPQAFTLPAGHTAVWSDRGRLRAAVQPCGRALGESSAPLLFTLKPGEEPEAQLMPEREQQLRLTFRFNAVERLPVAGRDVLLRSNSQFFEVWSAGEEGWSVSPHPKGLVQNGLEHLVWVLLGLSVGMIALGLGLAFRRRQQMALLVGKLRPNDILAPLSLRVSAHLIDLGLVTVVAEVVAWTLELQNPGLLQNMISMVVGAVHPYFVIYLLYLVLAEWAVGASLGKLLMGLRVITDKGHPVTLWAALVRNLIGYFERLPVLAAFLALPTILFTPSRQRLGDLLARTLVVQKCALERFKQQRLADAVLKPQSDSPDLPRPREEKANSNTEEQRGPGESGGAGEP